MFFPYVIISLLLSFAHDIQIWYTFTYSGLLIIDILALNWTGYVAVIIRSSKSKYFLSNSFLLLLTLHDIKYQQHVCKAHCLILKQCAAIALSASQ